MKNLPFRQINLDFHTSEWMPDVGSEFSEGNFKEALTVGHISSITLFAKCHHGWSYFPSKVNAMHPTLKTNLLDRQLSVCEKLGVRTQIYLSVGLDERKVNKYPQFMTNELSKDNTLLGDQYHMLCLNNDDYLSMIIEEVEEVMQTFSGRFDGMFIDIAWPAPCVCSYCITSMMNLGLDPENPEDVKKHQKIVYKKYTSLINAAVAKYNTDMAVFYNCGNIPRDDRSIAFANTKHFEIESLPTGGWGYDNFPLSAAYARVLGREFLGMTGKFHTTWGEFGGFKHPNALIYETALSLATGAKCSIGDQLHPLGKMDLATYRLIGKAYSQVEQKEKWCDNVSAIADIALYTTYTDDTRKTCPDVGANRILLAGKYLYNIIDSECEFNDYKLLIFPDIVEFNDDLTTKVNKYLENGGKILLTGKSGLLNGKYFRDFGVKYLRESEYVDTYLVPNYDMKPNGEAAYIMHSKCGELDISENVSVKAFLQNSYFNRTLRKFCSHFYTPNNPTSKLPGAVISGNIGVIAWQVFTEYGEQGACHNKQIVCDMIDCLLGTDKTLITNLQSNGIVTLMEQAQKNRIINHLLYCVTKQCGSVEMIEDAPITADTEVSIKLNKAPKRVYLAPQGIDIPFLYNDGVVSYKIERFTLHQMVVIDKG